MTNTITIPASNPFELTEIVQGLMTQGLRFNVTLADGEYIISLRR